MDELKRIKMSSLLILLLQFTRAAIGQRSLSFFVRVGDEATLPCNYVIHDQDECDGTNWIFSDSGSAVMLVKGGQIGNHAKSDRLRVTEKCSLVIKKVTEEDAGYYTCRQYNKVNQQQGSDRHLYLSVVTMTEHQDNDEVTLCCSVTRSGRRRLKVKWLLQGQDVDKDNSDIKTSQSYCSASTFSLQSSGEDTAAATESDSRSGLLRLVLVSVGLAALIMIVVAVSIWTRTKEKQTQMDEINVCYDVDDGTVNYENIRPPDGV
ncbi:Immunoglobulin superfamily member 10 [Dissostichus eleginoides]|nr:Immunoglobulin superfamily member 10 [Dissostichus eleginoides]